MKTLALLLLAVSAATPASAPAATHAKPYWLKTYSLAPYRESWGGDLEVKKVDEALPKIVEAIEKNGGRLTQPLKSFIASIDARQLSFIVPLKNSKALLTALRKLGKTDPLVRPIGAPIPLADVREKLARIGKERAENKIAFGQMPAAAEAIDEIIEHLANVEAVGRTTDGEILWNLTVKEKR